MREIKERVTGKLVTDCKKLRLNSTNYIEIRNYPIGGDPKVLGKINIKKFSERVESVAVRLRAVFF
jgi:hypothetical protein